MTKDYIKRPRLYVDQDLSLGADLPLADGHAHYLRTVLRRGVGDGLRLFNGRDGEWGARLTQLDKKGGVATLEDQYHPQPPTPPATRLYFAPLKKDRMDWLVEKAVELGATSLHPVITQNTNIPQMNADRLRRQIIEAAEQCERLTVPEITPPVALRALLADWPAQDDPLLACLERTPGIQPIIQYIEKNTDIAVFIGPEGGFTAEELESLRTHDHVKPVTLGPAILRAETAACMALSIIMAKRD